MNSSDENIIQTAQLWFTKDNELLLVTVANTWGSSPRPVGSMMLIRKNGEYIGSVSGGCIEEDLVKQYISNKISSKKVSLLSYGVGQLEAQRFGIPCGGKLELVVERLDSFDSLKPVEQTLYNSDSIIRHVSVLNGLISYSNANSNETTHFNGTTLNKVFGPQWQILLIGANDLAQSVANLATTLNYKIIVCDPREYINLNWIDDKISFTTEMPDDVVNELEPKSHSIVLALTHDPKMDDMALMCALEQDFFYVGAIGSKKTQAARLKRLKQLELTDTQISHLHGPVGLDIGSKAPAEIAISILAEIIQLRNIKKAPATINFDKVLKTA